MNNKLFRNESIDRISSPEQLNDYIKVSNPSVWVILTAVLALLITAIVWGFTGELSTTAETQGQVINNQIICYVDSLNFDEYQVGMSVSVDGEKNANIVDMQTKAESVEEVKQEIGEYAGYMMQLPEWSNKIIISNSGNHLAEGSFCQITITKNKVRPIDFLIH